MSKRIFNLVKFKDPEIRKDGNVIQVTLESSNKQEFAITISIENLKSIIAGLISLHSAAGISQALPPDDPKENQKYEPMPMTLHVLGLDLVAWPETQGMALRAQSVEKQEVQLIFQPSHLQFVFDSIRKSGNLPKRQAGH